jgi:hypothetical protein
VVPNVLTYYPLPDILIAVRAPLTDIVRGHWLAIYGQLPTNPRHKLRLEPTVCDAFDIIPAKLRAICGV